MSDEKITKLFGRTKLIVIQNQILEVAESIKESRSIGFVKTEGNQRPSVTNILNEAMKIGLEQMTGSTTPIPEWKSGVFGVTQMPKWLNDDWNEDAKQDVNPNALDSDDL